MGRHARRLGCVLALAVIVSPGPVFAQDSVAGARALLAAGDRSAARALLDRLIAADSLQSASRTDALLLRTTLEEDGAQYEERLRQLLDHGLREDRQAWVHLSLGQIAYLRRDFALALREFRRAREAGREEDGSLWEGLSALAVGDVEAARSALGRARNSGNRAIRHRALLALGDIQERAENTQEARNLYRSIREDGAEASGWWAVATLREAECLDRLGEAEEAAALRREILQERPDAYEAPLALARLETAPAEEAAPKTEGTQPGVATFAVQVGAFADPGHAEALLQVFTGRGVPGARIVKGSDGLSRVLVGSGLSRVQAESLGDSLGAALGVGFSLSPEKPR